MNPKIKAAVAVASQVSAVFGLRARIRDARRGKDKLALADSVITAFGVITGIALAVRTLREGEGEK